jgi:hypothetical protein
MLDARGHGESGGQAMDFGWAGDADIAAATGYLMRRPDVDSDRIGVVGMSMGGEEAIGATYSNGTIQAVVAEGATSRNGSDENWLSEQYGLRGQLQEQLEAAQDWTTGLFTSVRNPVSLHDAAAHSEAHYLLITAGGMPDEGNAASYVETAAPDRVEIWTVAQAGHIGGLRTAPDEWESRVIGFLNHQLVGDE